MRVCVSLYVCVCLWVCACVSCYIADYNEETSNRLIYDADERKYGKIPMKIYLLYLKSSGLYTILVFSLSAFGWQAMRIYTDVWLQNWTDIDSADRFVDVRSHAA